MSFNERRNGQQQTGGQLPRPGHKRANKQRREEPEFYYRVKDEPGQVPAPESVPPQSAPAQFYWNDQFAPGKGSGQPRPPRPHQHRPPHPRVESGPPPRGPKNKFNRREDWNPSHAPVESQPRPVHKEKTYPDDCLVCLQKIPIRSRIWVCRQCAVITHLSCVQSWAAKLQANAKPEDGRVTFSCPHCSYVYVNEEPAHTCFCGKEKNPGYSQFDFSNSCGKTCGKKVSAVCRHPCEAACHPGNCPPCNKKAIYRCFCEKAEREVTCSEVLNPKVLSCGQVCQKLLDCGVHRCAQECHDGRCKPCALTSLAPCFCGKESKVLRCAEKFACGKQCGKTLDCGKHLCKMECHEGPCESCPSPVAEEETCFCGAHRVEELLGHPRPDCSIPVPSCQEPCDQRLSCYHNCILNCHQGKCDCGFMVQANCRCGANSFQIRCSDKSAPVICTQVCGKKMNCGKHSCPRVCCADRASKRDEASHTCQTTCNRELDCKRHDCHKKCHKGPCAPCNAMLSRPLYCACQKEIILPPVLCGTEPPKCHRRCNKLMDCGHQCYFDCHFGDCPPCEETVDKPCVCGAQTMKQVKCSQLSRCTRTCDSVLKCGHRCGVLCHVPGSCDQQRAALRKRFPTDTSINQADREFILLNALLESSCLARCNRPRPPCGHNCGAYCHPGVPCPDRECKAMVSVTCQCGIKQDFAECRTLVEGNKAALPCDNKCLNQQRFKALYDLEAEDRKVYYSDFLVKFGRENPKFLKKIEKELREGFLNAQAKLSLTLDKGAGDRLQFVVTLLSTHYHLDVSFIKTDKGTFVDAVWSEKAMLPKVSLSAYLEKMRKKEIGKDHLPFEAVIKFYNLSIFDKPERLEEEFAAIKDKFYLEKSGSALFMFLWKKEDLDHFTTQLKKVHGNWASFVTTVKRSPDDRLSASEEEPAEERSALEDAPVSFSRPAAKFQELKASTNRFEGLVNN